jgi:hypothetical protein
VIVDDALLAADRTLGRVQTVSPRVIAHALVSVGALGSAMGERSCPASGTQLASTTRPMGRPRPRLAPFLRRSALAAVAFGAAAAPAACAGWSELRHIAAPTAAFDRVMRKPALTRRRPILTTSGTDTCSVGLLDLSGATTADAT